MGVMELCSKSKSNRKGIIGKYKCRKIILQVVMRVLKIIRHLVGGNSIQVPKA